MDDRTPEMRRGIPLSYLYEQLGEPSLRETNRNDHALVDAAMWAHPWNESPVPCTALKMAPPDSEVVPEDDWFIRPCALHQHLFEHFPLAPIGTQMW